MLKCKEKNTFDRIIDYNAIQAEYDSKMQLREEEVTPYCHLILFRDKNLEQKTDKRSRRRSMLTKRKLPRRRKKR